MLAVNLDLDFLSDWQLANGFYIHEQGVLGLIILILSVLLIFQ